jgi:hypothetical protein
VCDFNCVLLGYDFVQRKIRYKYYYRSVNRYEHLYRRYVLVSGIWFLTMSISFLISYFGRSMHPLLGVTETEEQNDCRPNLGFRSQVEENGWC